MLVEARWSTGAGLTAAECQALVRRHRQEVTVEPLTEPALWDGTIDDERYPVPSRT